MLRREIEWRKEAGQCIWWSCISLTCAIICLRRGDRCRARDYISKARYALGKAHLCLHSAMAVRHA